MQLRRLSTRCVDIRRSLVLLVVAMAEWLSLRWMVDGLELPLPRGYRVILEAPLVLIRLKLLFASCLTCRRVMSERKDVSSLLPSQFTGRRRRKAGRPPHFASFRTPSAFDPGS